MDKNDELNDLDEREIAEELALPKELVNIDLNEKKELLIFKRYHNELDWEEELLRRTELLARKRDFERIRRMTTDTSNRPKEKAAPVSKGKKDPVATGKRSRTIVEEDSSDGEVVVAPKKSERASKKAYVKESDSEEESMASEEGEEDEEEDDLFDSDEEEEIANIQAKRDSSESLTGLAEPSSKSSKKVGRRGRLYEDESDNSSGDEANYNYTEKIKQISAKDRAYRKMVDDDGDTASDEAGSLQDYQRIQVRRNFMEVNVHEPYFEQAVIGQFVRILIGHLKKGEEGSEEKGKDTAIYRVAEILDVVPYKRTYPLDPAGTTTTNKALKLTLNTGSKNEIVKRMDIISNSRMTEKELTFYLDNAREYNSSYTGLSVKAIDRRKRNLEKSIKHIYGHAEIGKMVEKSVGVATSKFLTTEYTSTRESLSKKMEKARAQGDYDVVDNIQADIDKLDNAISVHKEKIHKATIKQVSLNQRNKRANVVLDMEAGNERRKQVELENKQSAAIIASGGVVAQKVDVFARRECRPTVIWNTGTELIEKAAKAEKAAATVPSSTAPTVAPTAVAPVVAVEPPSISLSIITDTEHSLVGPGTPGTPATPGLSYQEAYPCFSLDEIRVRVKQQLGFDPIESFLVDKRQKYLNRISGDGIGLPPKGSKERESLRKGTSLSQYLASRAPSNPDAMDESQ